MINNKNNTQVLVLFLLDVDYYIENLNPLF